MSILTNRLHKTATASDEKQQQTYGRAGKSSLPEETYGIGALGVAGGTGAIIQNSFSGTGKRPYLGAGIALAGATKMVHDSLNKKAEKSDKEEGPKGNVALAIGTGSLGLGGFGTYDALKKIKENNKILAEAEKSTKDLREMGHPKAIETFNRQRTQIKNVNKINKALAGFNAAAGIGIGGRLIYKGLQDRANEKAKLKKKAEKSSGEEDSNRLQNRLQNIALIGSGTVGMGVGGYSLGHATNRLLKEKKASDKMESQYKVNKQALNDDLKANAQKFLDNEITEPVYSLNKRLNDSDFEQELKFMRKFREGRDMRNTKSHILGVFGLAGLSAGGRLLHAGLTNRNELQKKSEELSDEDRLHGDKAILAGGVVAGAGTLGVGAAYGREKHLSRKVQQAKAGFREGMAERRKTSKVLSQYGGDVQQYKNDVRGDLTKKVLDFKQLQKQQLGSKKLGRGLAGAGLALGGALGGKMMYTGMKDKELAKSGARLPVHENDDNILAEAGMAGAGVGGSAGITIYSRGSKTLSNEKKKMLADINEKSEAVKNNPNWLEEDKAIALDGHKELREEALEAYKGKKMRLRVKAGAVGGAGIVGGAGLALYLLDRKNKGAK